MFKGTVYIAAPEHCVSGGPELCHQFARMVADLGYSSAVCYYNAEGIFEWSSVPEAYDKYGVRVEADFDKVNQPENLLVITENTFGFFEKYSFQCELAFWWMSVDNFLETVPEEMRTNMRAGCFDVFRSPKLLHLVQSAYAYEFVEEKIGADKGNILYLADYISDAFRGTERIPVSMKRDWIAYNPKKGYNILYPMIQKYPQFEWIPLMDMTPQKVALCLQVSKIYVDFGNHPGKDRIPREAAMSGACVITNKRGSAGFYEDVPIPEQYKFENPVEQEEEIVELIEDIFRQYPKHRSQFDPYREKIRNEKNEFASQTAALIKRLENKK